jgi:Holliday junction resolvase RusA-like endonuclease
VYLRIDGLPKPQGSKRVFNGRVVEASGNALKVWRKAIADACQANVNEDHQLFLGPVKVEVDFYLPRPQTVKRSKRELPIVPPDLDKLARGLLDGIGQSEVVWGDDSQVVELIARKHYDDDIAQGATVTISEHEINQVH